MRFLLPLLLLLGSALPALAQQGKMWRIGVLAGSEQMVAIGNAFVRGMAELGYVEGKNIQYLQRHGDGSLDTSTRLAQELVAAKVDLIWVPGTRAATAARNATTTLPIVFSQVSDPVGAGFVRSLARPGTNATGLTILNAETGAKRIELLDEIFPNLRRVGVLHNPTDMASVAQLAVVEKSLRERGKDFLVAEVRSRDQFAAAFDALAKWRANALVILENSVTVRHREVLISLASKHGWPTINSSKEFAEAGGVISYGADWAESARRSASHVDRILKGAKPGDLPVDRATRFELVVNLKAAKSLGLSIPGAVLIRADHVIQ